MALWWILTGSYGCITVCIGGNLPRLHWSVHTSFILIIHTPQPSPLMPSTLRLRLTFTHSLPFFFVLQIAMGVADEKLQPLLPSDAPTDLVVLARICCDYDPDMRPSFGEVVPQLEATVAELRVGERGSLRHRSSSPAWGGCSG
eukprot:GHUV01054256.1.p1 GENE.GHUV01054256.1~~GHUV01054256.1.p1  ORF type:complete len:144 (-),score=28.26 GHUV01054256.1:13-444(-)